MSDPVELGWARTIYTSQGKTIGRLYVDATGDETTIGHGWTHVFVGRVRALEDLYLIGSERNRLTYPNVVDKGFVKGEIINRWAVQTDGM